MTRHRAGKANELCMDMRKLVGRNAARLRKKAGLTQEQLAERCGLSQQYISKLEQGGRNPTIVTLYEIAKASASAMWSWLGRIEGCFSVMVRITDSPLIGRTIEVEGLETVESNLRPALNGPVRLRDAPSTRPRRLV
jgi:transcriptional regulator with XRE-family HTH domain